MRLARKQGINIVCIVVSDQYNPCGWAQALVRAQGGVARVLNASPKELAAVLHLLRTSPGANHPAARPSSHAASMLPAGAGAGGGEGESERRKHRLRAEEKQMMEGYQTCKGPVKKFGRSMKPSPVPR